MTEPSAGRYDIAAIKRRLPHRYPLLMVDRIEESGPGYAIGIKNVTANEPCFQGRFPGRAVMPGALIAEALMQTSAFVGRSRQPDEDTGTRSRSNVWSAHAGSPVSSGDDEHHPTRSVPDPACSAPEQHVQGAGAAVGWDCGAEREHFGAVTQPSVDVRFHDRQAVPRSESLAVDDAHATSPTPAGVLEKLIKRRRGVRHDAPVQIEVRLDPESASPQPLHLTPADAAPGEAQYIARPDVRSPLRLGKPPWARRLVLRSPGGSRYFP